MADKLPLAQYAGGIKQLQAGDTIAGPNVDAFTTSLQGTVPASGGGTTKFLRADASWQVPAGGGGIATDPIWTTKGDTVAATGSAAAVRIPIGADGTTFEANSAASMGVCWAQVPQTKKKISASFTLFADNCFFVARKLTLLTGVTITMQSNTNIMVI